MEILSTQVGQGFASNSGSAVAPQNTERNTEKTDGDQPGLSVVETEKRVQNSAQVEQEMADNQNNGGSQERDVEQAVEEVQSFLQVQNRNLAFSIDEDTRRSVVTVKDTESGDVIRQIPSDEVLRLAERIKELQEDVGSSVGVLLNNQV